MTRVLFVVLTFLQLAISTQAFAAPSGKNSLNTLEFMCTGPEDIERCLQEGLAIIRENTSCVALPAESSAICKYEMPHVISEFGPAPKPLGVSMCFVPMENCTKATLVDPDKRTYACPNGYAPKQRVKSNEEARGYAWVSAIHCER